MTKISSLTKIILSAALTLCLMAGSAFAAPILKMNSHGHDVQLLQQRLQSLGYNVKSIDGIFGNEVYRAVIAFQRDNKLTINGVVDAKTWKTLQSATGKAAKSAADTTGITASSKAKPAVTVINTTVKKDTGKSTAIATKKVPESQPFLDKSKVSSIIATAKKQIGVPYVSGGTTPKGFDCSGFLQYVFAQNGMDIPRLADEQYHLGKKASASQLVAGDLVFFDTDGTGVSHCGIYLGNNDFIHASYSKGIRIDKINDIYYWKDKYYGGKHIVK